MKITLLSIIWYLASILIIYGGIKYTLKYKLIQFNLKSIIKAIKSKSNNDISPISSLCISLAAKIGVGSLSGIALAIYYGGIGTIFWIVVISLIVTINTYLECLLGIKYRERINNTYIGGPSYYIKKCLNNKCLSYLYSILIIISYGILFLSIQTNTIVNTINYYQINTNYTVIILFIITLFIIKGTKRISIINSYLVPIMLIMYLLLGMYVTFINIKIIPSIIYEVIKEAFTIKSITPVFLIGMQRAIFITESSIGTSAISSSICDNEPHKQAMLEVFGIYITIFLVCLTTFIIIATSNYQLFTSSNMSGIELLLYSFKYHFNMYGVIILSIITILFAFSTIISSYFFGESNLVFITSNNLIKKVYKLIFMTVILTSSYIKAKTIWNLTDLFVGILAIINMYSIIKIEK